MARAELSTPRRTRIGVILLVAGLHVLAVLGLIRAFAPEFTAQVTKQVVSAFTVTVTTPTPTQTPEPPPVPKAPEPEGASAPAGKKATPKEVTAPRPKVAIARDIAPKVASTGTADTSGARDAGEATGAGGEGQGTGSGNSGSGQGSGGVAVKAVKISGDINSARDYPRESRDARIGDHVIVALTVGTDGKVRACRVHRASRDPEADQITCRLAMQRFRFKPATDAQGNPVESVFGWQQRWFIPGGKN
ncbi:MAG: TonB family protein [Novosphingobium sp.]|nr:TonB family protein [Novosphingobium sp.]